MESPGLTNAATAARKRVETLLCERDTSLRARQIGTVQHVGGGIARISGLPGVTSEELLRFPDGLQGIAINLEPDEVGSILLGNSHSLSAGSPVRATGRIVDVPVGEQLLGRVIDATGRALDGEAPPAAGERRPIERPAPPILARSPVTVPLQTGIKAVDALIPLGRGQRELIVGDRQTGKTAIAVDTILNQSDKNVICVYCAIGQRGAGVARVIATLRERGAMAYSIVVVSSGDDPPGLQYITPYAATTIAEYFMERGRDVLIVYDDLTRHARAYRELSLLLRRPPGREAFPGDIFYIHSRLLERATHLREEYGGGSLTALPIVETQAQDISAYIPTNLISITDGQIYLSPTLFHKGQLPAIDPGRSVSRVGGKTQFPAYRAVASDLRLAYAQYEELETFSRFATRLDDATRATIEHGLRVRALLRQAERAPQSAAAQIATLHALNTGVFDEVELDALPSVEAALNEALTQQMPELGRQIEAAEALTSADWNRLSALAEQVVQGVAAGGN